MRIFVDLQFALLTSESKSAPVTIPVATSVTSFAHENRKIKSLEEEIETLKITLIESKEQNQKLETVVEGYKRLVPGFIFCLYNLYSHHHEFSENLKTFMFSVSQAKV